MNKLFLVLVFGLMIMGFVSGASVDEEILEEFENGNEKVRVIVEKKEVQNNFNSFKSINVKNSSIKKITENNEKFTALVSLEELEELEKNPEFSNIRRDIPLNIFMHNVVGIVDANKTWELISTGINLTGIKQSICILDTGINRSHPDFSERIVAEKCFCSVSDFGNGGCCPNTNTTDDFADDDQGHGTHVAGIAGANGGINGIATDIGLVIIKIMDNNGAGTSSDMENAVQWCIDNAATYNISVITASLGDEGTRYTSGQQASCNSRNSSLTAKIDSAFAQNISVTIATGNNGWSDGITWPSCIINATPVGATSKVDSLVYNRNSLIKLLAPGGSTVGTITCSDPNSPLPGYICSTGYQGGYLHKSGTSMSTPVVAGAIAIINQFLALGGRTMTPSEIEDVLYNNGENITESGNNYTRINVYDAILSLDETSPNVSLVSPSDNYINISRNQTFICNATDWQLNNITLKVWNSSGLYYNETKNITGTSNQTSFNLTYIPIGNYDWNCEVIDTENNLGTAEFNYTLTIGAVEVVLNSPENNSYTNMNYTEFNCTSITDSNFDLDNISFFLWNSSGNLLKNETRNISGTTNTTIFNYTFVDEYNYTWECVAINNESYSGNGINFTITYDITTLNISNLTETGITSSSVTINWNTSEESNSSISGGINGNNSGYILNHSITISGLSASTTYTYNATSCDRAGNCESENGSFATSAAPVSSGGGGGSPAKTYEIENEDFKLGVDKELKVRDKMTFSLASGRHELKISRINKDSVDITIQSDPLYLNLKVGEKVKLNLSSPSYYDLLVKLNSINSRKANITIMRIFEEVEKEIIEEVENETAEQEEVMLRIFDEPEVDKNYKPFIFGGIVALIVLIGIILELIKSGKIKKLEVHHGLKEYKSKKLKASKTSKKDGKQDKKAKVKTFGKR